MKYMSKHAGIVALALVPMVASADAVGELVKFEDNSGLFASISLWSTLIIALSASVLVWMGGRKMRGGVFGSVLTFFSIGMTLVFLGFTTEIPWLEEQFPQFYLKLTHDSLYIMGYILMVVAANRLLKVIKGE